MKEHKGGGPPLWGTPRDTTNVPTPFRGGRPAKPGDAEKR
jgi:hypothetical protein